MTDSTLPRWEVTYRRACRPDPEKITVHAADLVAAVKAARVDLTEAAKTWPILTEADAMDIAQPFRLLGAINASERDLRAALDAGRPALMSDAEWDEYLTGIGRRNVVSALAKFEVPK